MKYEKYKDFTQLTGSLEDIALGLEDELVNVDIKVKRKNFLEWLGKDEVILESEWPLYWGSSFTLKGVLEPQEGTWEVELAVTEGGDEVSVYDMGNTLYSYLDELLSDYTNT